MRLSRKEKASSGFESVWRLAAAKADASGCDHDFFFAAIQTSCL